MFMWDQRDGSLVLNLTNPDFIGTVGFNHGAILYLKSLFTLIISSSLGLTSVRLDKGPLIYKTLIKDCHSAKYLDLLSNGNLVANCLTYLRDEVISIYNLSSNGIDVKT